MEPSRLWGNEPERQLTRLNPPRLNRLARLDRDAQGDAEIAPEYKTKFRLQRKCRAGGGAAVCGNRLAAARHRDAGVRVHPLVISQHVIAKQRREDVPFGAIVDIYKVQGFEDDVQIVRSEERRVGKEC